MFNQYHSQDLDADYQTLRGRLKTPVLVSAMIATLFFGVGGAWSVLVPIASAALATGTIRPEGHRKTVQHLEGGIVRDILVKDGDAVEAGDVLIVLEDTQALTAFRVQETRLLALRAMEARLSAEENGKEVPDWKLVPQAPGREDAIQDQMSIFLKQMDSEESERNILGQRVNQLDEEINGLKAQIKSQSDQLFLIRDEITMVETLTDKGLARKPRLLDLKRQKADISGLRASNKSSIARAKQSIGETQMQILNLKTRRRDEAATRLGDIRVQIADLEERMAGTRDILKRTSIIAPVSGTVFDVRLQTTGGVLRAGDPVLDIVPLGDDLLVDARVQPNDIDVVAEGLTAEITLTAFPQRNLPKLKGEVLHVSADRMTDQSTGEVYYLARIEIDRHSLANLGTEIELIPGMPADAMIFTGSQTFMDYLVGPLIDSIDRSFRER